MTAHRLVIAGDADTGERYLAELLDADPHGHDPPPNPIVRVLLVIRYPAQRARAHPEIPMEFPAIAYNTILRLQVFGPADNPGRTIDRAAYDESLRAAIAAALMEARTDAERAILERHENGDFQRKRVFIQFTKQNWLIIKSTKGGQSDAGLSETVSADHRDGQTVQRRSALPPV